MLYKSNLENIVIGRHQIVDSDRMVILSGYVGPNPIRRLQEISIPVKVIYGMYGESGISERLHNILLSLNDEIENVNIFYSNIPVHSKCYIWLKNNKIVHSLIGSANFSTKGLTSPFREVLAETTLDTFESLENYLDIIINSASNCRDVVLQGVLEQPAAPVDEEFLCSLPLYDPRTNETQNANGLNWGQSEQAHTNSDDANIPIRTYMIRNYPNLFPPKLEYPNENVEHRRHRHNDTIDIIWDDGTTMVGLLEGNQVIDGVVYPKQISSSPYKKLLGEYLRDRLSVARGNKVRMEHLSAYGRSDIEISLLEDGIYYFDFSID